MKLVVCAIICVLLVCCCVSMERSQPVVNADVVFLFRDDFQNPKIFRACKNVLAHLESNSKYFNVNLSGGDRAGMKITLSTKCFSISALVDEVWRLIGQEANQLSVVIISGGKIVRRSLGAQDVRDIPQIKDRVPRIIKLATEVDRENFTGRWAGGQFFAEVCSIQAQAENKAPDETDNYYYALLFLFDHNGVYRETKYSLIGKRSEVRFADVCDNGEEIIEQWLLKFSDVEYGDIYVEMFELKIQEEQVGLIAEEYDGEYQAEFYPFMSGYYSPWDGEYNS